MRRHSLFIALCLLIRPVLAAAAADDAVELLTVAIRAGAVRAVPESVIRADAARIAATLTPARRRELLAGALSAEELVRPSPRLRTQSSDLRSLAAAALGDYESDLLFVPLPPCRVIDTREGGGVLPANTGRNFVVAGTDDFPAQGGTDGGCGIPEGALNPLASAVVINFIAVGPLGPGNLRAWEYGGSLPDASVLNYTNVPDLNIANGVIVPIAGVAWQPFDVRVRADVSGTHVVADVMGYFTLFPKDSLKTTLTQASSSGVFVGGGTCQQLSSCTVTSPVAGKVLTTGFGSFLMRHTLGTRDALVATIETNNPVICPSSAVAAIIQVPEEIPSSFATYSFSVTRSFPVVAGAATTFRLSGKMEPADPTGDEWVNYSIMECLFVPD